MTAFDGRSWLSQLLGLCISLLLAAVAVYVAVQLIESVWIVLTLVLSVVVAAGIGWRIVRYRRGGW